MILITRMADSHYLRSGSFSRYSCLIYFEYAFMFLILFFINDILRALWTQNCLDESKDVYYRVAHTIDGEQLINGVCYEARKRNDLRQSDRELLISRKGGKSDRLVKPIRLRSASYNSAFDDNVLDSC